MVFRTVKYWFRKDTLEQILRDDAVTTAHAAAIARGESRILASGKDGNLFSYKLEEYGAERNSRIPITSVVGHIAWTGMWAIITAGLIGTSIVLIVSSGGRIPVGSEWISVLVMTALVLLFGLFFVDGLRDLLKEIKAAKLRSHRGIPRPID